MATTMIIVACLLLLLSFSTAGQATPTSSLISPPIASTSGTHDTAEQDNLHVKRTSGSSSHRPWLSHVQVSAVQPVSPTHISSGGPAAPSVVGDHHNRWPGLSTAPPSRVPADGPSADPIVAESSGKRPYTANKRPRGSHTNDPVAKALALREAQARARKKRGKRTALMSLGRLKYATASLEDIRALRNGRNKRWLSTLTPEEKRELNKKQNESTKRWQERQKAKLRGNSSPGPPLRKQGRKGLDWEQEQARVEEARQYEPADMRMEEATQHVGGVPHVPARSQGPRTLRASTLESWTGSSSHATLPDVAHQFFPPGPSSSPLDHRLLLSAPRLINSQQTEATPRQAALPPATTWEEERLQFTLAPPGEQDRLRLTLAPPRHD